MIQRIYTSADSSHTYGHKSTVRHRVVYFWHVLILQVDVASMQNKTQEIKKKKKEGTFCGGDTEIQNLNHWKT